MTDRNPHQSVRNFDKQGVFYLIPLDKIGTEAEIREIIQTISVCVRANNFDELQKLVDRKFADTPTNLLETINQVAELKPNALGLGLNINGIIDLFNKWRKRKQAGAS